MILLLCGDKLDFDEWDIERAIGRCCFNLTSCHIGAICLGFNWASACRGEQSTTSGCGDLRGNLFEGRLEEICGLLCSDGWLWRLKLVIHGQSV